MESNWISVKDRVPPVYSTNSFISKQVICLFENGEYRVCQYNRLIHQFVPLYSNDTKINHWMPLPEPPKE